MEGDYIRSRRLTALVRYWAQKQEDTKIPPLARIDPLEIPRLLPVVLLADIGADGARIRLLGSETTAAYGRELRGKPVSEIAFGDFTPFWREAFALVATSATPVSARGSYRNGPRDCVVEMVLMPLADNQGRVVRLFGGLAIRHAPLDCVVVRQHARAISRSAIDDPNSNFGRTGCCSR